MLFWGKSKGTNGKKENEKEIMSIPTMSIPIMSIPGLNTPLQMRIYTPSPMSSQGLRSKIVADTNNEQMLEYPADPRLQSTLPDMASFQVMLFLFVLLQQSLPSEGKDPAFTALLTDQPHVQREIVNKHNELRKAVSPTASNMLKMEWSTAATVNAQRWANKCILEHSNAQDRKI
ncbi:hypothetical protein STEG23_003726, partial [Scotinomys teguina]